MKIMLYYMRNFVATDDSYNFAGVDAFARKGRWSQI